MDNCVQSYGGRLSKDPIYVKLLKFLDIHFSTFKFPKNLDHTFKQSEDEITKALVNYFDDIQERTSGDFKFVNQDTNKSDIGVIMGRRYDPYATKSFFLIEAKRLPTPCSPQRDPNEYVLITPPTKGRGGIERFKIGKHGRGYSKVAMLGYIQDGQSSSLWRDRINEIIISVARSGKVGWSTDEILRDSTAIPNRFYSIHNRTKEGPITIWHFFEQEK